MTLAPESDRTLACLVRHARNPSAYLAMNEGNCVFRTEGSDGLVIYRRARGFLVQFGGVFASPEERDHVLERFLAHARAERRRVVAVQLMREDADQYASSGFTVNQLGASYARSLGGFTLAGKPFVKIRNKISRARRDGVRVDEVRDVEARTATLISALDEVDRLWLKDKGRTVRELDFMIGQRGGTAERHRRLFVARHGDRVVGYQTFSPVFGCHSGWLHDLSRRLPDAPVGTSELVISTAIEQFVAEGCRYLHFGLTPFTGVDPGHRLPGASPVGDRIIAWLAAHGQAVYPAKKQVSYKLKWQPDLIQPEYVAFQGDLSLRAVWRLLRMTNALTFRRGANDGIRGGVGAQA